LGTPPSRQTDEYLYHGDGEGRGAQHRLGHEPRGATKPTRSPTKKTRDDDSRPAFGAMT